MFGRSQKGANAKALDLFLRADQQAGEMPQALIRTRDLYPVYISPSFQRIFGVDPERLVDDIETLLRFVPQNQRRKVKNTIAEWDQRAPLSLTADYQRLEGESPRKLQLTLTSVLDGSHILATVQDITAHTAELAHLEEQAQLAAGKAQQRSDFLSQMSHEIRTPLNGIRGMVALAKDHRANEERLVDDLNRASELSSYLLNLVNDVLDMSRLEAGRVELDLAPFDIRMVARELRSMFERQAADKGLTYTVEAQECPDAFLIGDRMRLNQIIVNFISNAIKFTDAGGQVTITILEMQREDDIANYMIRVRVTGKGMDPRFISRIFRPFEQEDATIARRYGGTGLGMAITDQLTSLMGGQIVVDSELGRGSDFTVYIPFACATEEQAEQLRSSGDTLETGSTRDVAVAYDFSGKRYLMAEDNEINAMIAIEMLETLGAKVDRAADGDIVVDMFAACEPGTYDAILMDIQMPTMNGWEAARAIRALDHVDAARIPIVALSANTYTEDVKKSRAAGMNGHAGKPINFDELKAELAAATAEQAYERGSA